jgi:hypothetical protein
MAILVAKYRKQWADDSVFEILHAATLLALARSNVVTSGIVKVNLLQGQTILKM